MPPWEAEPGKPQSANLVTHKTVLYLWQNEQWPQMGERGEELPTMGGI